MKTFIVISQLHHSSEILRHTIQVAHIFVTLCLFKCFISCVALTCVVFVLHRSEIFFIEFPARSLNISLQMLGPNEPLAFWRARARWTCWVIHPRVYFCETVAGRMVLCISCSWSLMLRTEDVEFNYRTSMSRRWYQPQSEGWLRARVGVNYRFDLILNFFPNKWQFCHRGPDSAEGRGSQLSAQLSKTTFKARVQ